ncbi:MAG TPA: DUF1015 domain-containing protein [Myxococcota bacterium]|nr:DUF1015 domain-containing protein [Myxococcota bacterium]HOH77668.1 DUF1015 domain-containing protein [Myxococcota bacterium]HPV04004.1 DUF1015 domain-containing protein [Myxococcota bacterium]
MRKFESIGIAVPDVLIPAEGSAFDRWAVVACDQYTSQPDYWAAVRDKVGDAPSTLNIIYPEVFLNEPESDKEARIAAIHDSMGRYIESGLLARHEGLVYVERTVDSRTRRGIVACIDLEKYDFNRGSTTLVRATEGTILERIPPRVRIRKGAPLELPHILILVDDPDDAMIGPIEAARDRLEKLYDFELMQEGGHLAGYLVDQPDLEAGIVDALKALADPGEFANKYALKHQMPVLLFAVGDGNHSLATAKAIWEDAKAAGAGLDSPLRWALVEFENLHDKALVFEPIHRVLFELNPDRDILTEFETHYAGRIRRVPVKDIDALKSMVAESDRNTHRIGVACPDGYLVLEVTAPDAGLPVGTLQVFLDRFMKDGGAREIDYVHGADVVNRLGRSPGNIGFFLPAMDKHDLFRTVILDGVLPRKTFSMGEAHEKRFYMECRRLG